MAAAATAADAIAPATEPADEDAFAAVPVAATAAAPVAATAAVPVAATAATAAITASTAAATTADAFAAVPAAATTAEPDFLIGDQRDCRFVAGRGLLGARL